MIRTLLVLAMFLLLVAEPLGLTMALAPGVSAKNGLLYLLVVLIGFQSVAEGNRRFELSSVIVPHGLYVLYALGSILVLLLFGNLYWYDEIKAGIAWKAGAFDNWLMLLVSYVGLRNSRDAFWALRALIWLVIVVNTVTVFEGTGLLPLGLVPAREDGRMLGPFGEPNLFAAFLALFIPGIVALALTETGWRKWVAWVGICCSATALLLTGSRGGVVSLVGGALFASTMLRSYIGLRTLLLTTAIGLALVFGAVGVAVLTGQHWLLFERFIWLSGEGTVDALSSGRLGIWQEPLLRLLQNPLTLITGYGWDTYAQAPYFRFAPHNSYLKIFYELGFLGLGFLVAALVAIVARAHAAIGTPNKQTFYHVAAFLCGFPAFLLAIFFVDFVAPLFAWAYAGLVLRMAMEAERVARERVHGIAVKTAEKRI